METDVKWHPHPINLHVYWCCVCVFSITHRYILRPAESSEEKKKPDVNNLRHEEELKLQVSPGEFRPEQLQQQPLVSGLGQVMDEVSQSRLSGLQLSKQNL